MAKQARVRPSWKKLNKRKVSRRALHRARIFQCSAERKLIGKLAEEIRKEEDKLTIDQMHKIVAEEFRRRLGR